MKLIVSSHTETNKTWNFFHDLYMGKIKLSGLFIPSGIWEETEELKNAKFCNLYKQNNNK